MNAMNAEQKAAFVRNTIKLLHSTPNYKPLWKKLKAPLAMPSSEAEFAESVLKEREKVAEALLDVERLIISLQAELSMLSDKDDGRDEKFNNAFEDLKDLENALLENDTQRG